MVIEVEPFSIGLYQFVSQAVGEIYAQAKALELAPSSHSVYVPNQSSNHRKNVIRGALTAGENWLFIVLVMNPDGDGATYRWSEQITVVSETPPGFKTVTSPWPDIITAILVDWVSFLPFIGFTFAKSTLTYGHGIS